MCKLVAYTRLGSLMSATNLLVVRALYRQFARGVISVAHVMHPVIQST